MASDPNTRDDDHQYNHRTLFFLLSPLEECDLSLVMLSSQKEQETDTTLIVPNLLIQDLQEYNLSVEIDNEYRDPQTDENIRLLNVTLLFNPRINNRRYGITSLVIRFSPSHPSLGHDLEEVFSRCVDTSLLVNINNQQPWNVNVLMEFPESKTATWTVCPGELHSYTYQPSTSTMFRVLYLFPSSSSSSLFLYTTNQSVVVDDQPLCGLLTFREYSTHNLQLTSDP